MLWGWEEWTVREKGSAGLGEQQVNETREKGSSTTPRIGAWAGVDEEHRQEAGWLGSSVHKRIFGPVEHPHETVLWAVESLMLKKRNPTWRYTCGCHQYVDELRTLPGKGCGVKREENLGKNLEEPQYLKKNWGKEPDKDLKEMASGIGGKSENQKRRPVSDQWVLNSTSLSAMRQVLDH